MTNHAEELLERPGPHAHLVQLYDGDDRLLSANISRYVREGLRRGGGAIVVSTPARRAEVARQLRALGADPEKAARDGRLLFLDAQELLRRIAGGGQPDWDGFDEAVGGPVREMERLTGAGGLRAYGEMVGLLWKEGRIAAALSLEELWNRLLEGVDFKLYCAYPVDVFSSEFRIPAMDAVLCSHTHMVPAAAGARLQSAIDRAMDAVLGPQAAGLRILIQANFRPSWAAVPRGEASILWLRNNLPQCAEEILARAQRYYQGGEYTAAEAQFSDGQ